MTAAMPLRVVEGAYELIEGASLYKTFTTGLSPAGKPYNRPAGVGNAPLLVVGATTFPPAGGLYSSLCVSFILPPLAGEVRRGRIGGGERSEPISRMLIITYDTER